MRGYSIIGAALLAVIGGRADAATISDPICPDRPGKGTGTCTVPAGRWQIETGLVDWSHANSGGVTTDFTVIGASLIKYGVSDRADIELGMTPLQILRVRGDDESEGVSGFGDVLVKAKYRLTAEGAPVAVALDPFVKLPTADRRLGNGKVEAGLTVPVSAALGVSGLTLTAAPQIDWRADFDGHGRHAAMTQVVGLSLAASPRLTVSAELWGAWDWNPQETVRQASADGSIAYLLGNDIQLDAGANLGLTRHTPDVQLYAGVSARF